MFAAADERAASLYPGKDRSGLTIGTLQALDVRFFVARAGGKALGCGGYVVGPGGTAELTRFFVHPSARRQGIGRAILAAVEASAVAEGVELIRLETGVRSHEALGMYARAGYRRSAPFGSYAHEPSSVFLERRLTA